MMPNLVALVRSRLGRSHQYLGYHAPTLTPQMQDDREFSWLQTTSSSSDICDVLTAYILSCRRDFGKRSWTGMTRH